MSQPTKYVPWDVVLAAGGTGGHILPALALADALEAQGLDRHRIGFVGGLHGSEAEIVPDAGLEFVGFDVRGLVRGISPKAISANLSAIRRLLAARKAARKLVAQRKVQIVCGMGGYASVPAVLAGGRSARRPDVFVYESNSVPGIATRVAARRASFVGCAFEGTLVRLSEAERVGFIVRSELEQINRELERPRAAAVYGIDAGRRVLVVMGGSQGARSLNEATIGLLSGWRNRADVAVVHLTGRRDHDQILSEARAILPADDSGGFTGPDTIQYVPVAFESQMQRVFGLADLVVCRSGAATCAELVVTETPAVCVPYPHATADHQALNAAELESAGAVRVVADAELSGERLVDLTSDLLGDDASLGRMRSASRSLGAMNGREVLAEHIMAGLRAEPR